MWCDLPRVHDTGAGNKPGLGADRPAGRSQFGQREATLTIKSTATAPPPPLSLSRRHGRCVELHLVSRVTPPSCRGAADNARTMTVWMDNARAPIPSGRRFHRHPAHTAFLPRRLRPRHRSRGDPPEVILLGLERTPRTWVVLYLLCPRVGAARVRVGSSLVASQEGLQSPVSRP